MSVKYTFKIKNIVYLKINTLIIKKLLFFLLNQALFPNRISLRIISTKMIKNMIIFCQGVMYYEKN